MELLHGWCACSRLLWGCRILGMAKIMGGFCLRRSNDAEEVNKQALEKWLLKL